MSPTNIRNVDLSYLPKCTEFFFYRFLENNDSFQILVGFRLNRFSFRGRLTDKF